MGPAVRGCEPGYQPLQHVVLVETVGDEYPPVPFIECLGMLVMAAVMVFIKDYRALLIKLARPVHPHVAVRPALVSRVDYPDRRLVGLGHME